MSSPKDLLISIGDGVIIEAKVVDARGNPIPGAPIAWRSSPAFIAKVDQNGLVTAVSNGTTTIDVTSGGASGTQNIKVQQRATSVAMQSTRDTLWAGWPPTPFSATGIDANDNLIRRPSLTWQSSDPTVALVDDTGLVTPVAPGEVNITASSDGVAATSHLLVKRYGVDDGTNRRAIHMGGNWGTNRLPGIQELPPDYFLRLADLNVNWVGISVALFIDDSIDDSVGRVYDRGVIRTFTDEALIEAIRAFRQRGFTSIKLWRLNQSRKSLGIPLVGGSWVTHTCPRKTRP